MWKPKIKKMNKFVSFITFGTAIGITLAPFGIYIQEQYIKNEEVINHESIHWQQQMEMLIIFFYLWYGIEWLIRLFVNGKEHAYYLLSFEQEAFSNENDLKYLNKRKHYIWIKFLRVK